MDLEDFDDQINAGRVELALFLRLREAEIYGTATPMQWLGKVLSKLQFQLKDGRIVEIEDQNGIEIITDLPGFYEFFRRNFPDAFHVFINKG